MKRITIIFTAILTCMSITAPIMAQVQLKKLGQSTMNFLEVGVVPKASAMGNAYEAVGTGAESIYYNPAGLANGSTNYNAFIATTNWIANIKYYVGAFAFNLGDIGTIGLNFLTVDYGDINGTRLTAQVADPTGYVDLGKLHNVGAYTYGLSYSRQVSNQFSMGGTVQYVGQHLSDTIIGEDHKQNQANILSFNFGVLYYTGFKSFRFGMSIRNFAPAVKYEEVTASLPVTFSLGLAMDMMDLFAPNHSNANSLLLSTNFMHPNDYTERMNIGVDYSFMNLLSLRGGYQFNRDLAGLTAGFGVSPDIGGAQIELSYSYSAFEIFDGVNRFSMDIAF